jgi:hypothetical protein
MWVAIKSFVLDMPKWVWGIVMVYLLLEPASHFWLVTSPPEGTAFTGLHHPDSVIFLHAMRMFETDFFAPFVSSAAESPFSYRYFPVPFLWMYGIVGAVGRILHIPVFHMLGIANGVGIAVYLMVVYKLFQAIWPKHANRAFLLLTLGGGVGGALYVMAAIAGSVNNPDFQQMFFRYAFYELMEGPRMAPWLIMPRLYYTFPLALCFGSILAVVHWFRNPSRKLMYIAAALLLLATFLNLRLGPIAWGVIMLALFTHRHFLLKQRLILAGWLTAAVGVSAAVTVWMLSWNPVYSETAITLIRRSMWFSPFISVAFFHVLLLPKMVLDHRSKMKRWDAVWFHAAWGYLLAFGGFYGLYLLYYGEIWRTADYSAAVRVSDPALLGALAGGIWGWRTGKSETESHLDAMHTWILLWFGLFLVLAISAWGQGWFIQFGPQRVMLFLGPPLCLLTAHGLGSIGIKRPRFVNSYLGVMIGCGVISIGVSALAFQGPLGHDPNKSAFHEYHSEVMSEADEECLRELGPGRVMTPTSLPSFGDIVSVRGNLALYGLGAWDLSDRSALEISEAVDVFYSFETSDVDRFSIAEEWGIDWVYCPDTSPVDPWVLDDLKEAQWLEVVAESGRAVLFRRN